MTVSLVEIGLLDTAGKTSLLNSLQQVADDAGVRAVVLTGSGRTFCVGQDLVSHASSLSFDTVDEHYAPIVRLLASMPKPVVAAVNGTCVGAGLGFALACDFRVFSASARLGTAFTGIGLTCDSGLSFFLPAAVGRARAQSLILSPSLFTASDAVSWGISGTVVPPDDVLSSAQDLAAQLALGPTLAYAESKALLNAGLEEALAAESAAQHRLGATADHRNAVQSFLAKEKPKFSGR